MATTSGHSVVDLASTTDSPFPTPRRLLRLRSDAALADRFAGGDDAAFTVLYDRYRNGVVAVCAGVLGAGPDAEVRTGRVTAGGASAPGRTVKTLEPLAALGWTATLLPDTGVWYDRKPLCNGDARVALGVTEISEPPLPPLLVGAEAKTTPAQF